MACCIVVATDRCMLKSGKHIVMLTPLLLLLLPIQGAIACQSISGQLLYVRLV
jgi:hypothetical protein